MLTIDFINVGYGDAILVQERSKSAQNYNILIDCGALTTGATEPHSKRVSAFDFLLKRGIDTLDLLVLTHLHLDHSGGLRHLLPAIHVREFWSNYVPDLFFWGQQVIVPDNCTPEASCLLQSLNVYLEALDRLRKENAIIHCITKSRPACILGDALIVETFSKQESLYKRQGEIWQAVLNGQIDSAQLDELDGFINNTSIRMRLTYAGHSIELPGDVYAACWEQHTVAPCSIVKLPHHGHQDSISVKLAAMLRSQYAVVSVSNTRTDNCPSREAIQLISNSATKLLFTDAVQTNGRRQYHESVQFQISSDGVLKLIQDAET